ncbi:hypothetical protein NMY22_g4593 [Coprinellus aureogranulatus]|nr:hypothetical protein NMY22_g4593 [Coprinellus aureogranulatus]
MRRVHDGSCWVRFKMALGILNLAPALLREAVLVIMSLQVNISSKEIAEAYENVVNGNGINWAIFTYAGASNDLKVQATGDGGLEELEEEFSDGRQSQLPKLVQINWCGDGVPEVKKGLFHTHSKTVANFLRGTHVVINARNEGDVTPEIIMKRVEAASGAKYSVQKEAPRKAEPIAPPRSSYTPVGKVDMAALKRNVPPAPKPAPPAAAKPTPSAASLYGRGTASTSGSAPADAWPEEKPAAKSPQPRLQTSPAVAYYEGIVRPQRDWFGVWSQRVYISQSFSRALGSEPIRLRLRACQYECGDPPAWKIPAKIWQSDRTASGLQLPNYHHHSNSIATGPDPATEMDDIDGDHDGFSASTVELIRIPAGQWDCPLYRSKVEARVAVLERELRALRTCTNKTTVTCRLPPEVLSTVFIVLKSMHATCLKRSALNWNRWGEDLSWIRATHVCRHWRQVALNCPALWAGLPLRRPEIADVFLRRAKAGLLDIEYHGRSSESELLLTKVMKGGIHRLRSLRLTASSEGFLSNLLSGSTGSAPFLNELSIFNGDGPPDALPAGFLGGGAPSLARLELDGVSFEWESLPMNSGLLHLLLAWRPGKPRPPASVKPSVDIFVNAMQQFFSLRTLELRHVLPDTTSTTRTTLALPALGSLRLWDSSRNIQSFLQMVSVPNASSITIFLSDDQVNRAIPGLLSSLKISLTPRSGETSCSPLLVNKIETYVPAGENPTSTVVLRCTHGVSRNSLHLLLELHDPELTVPLMYSQLVQQVDFTTLRSVDTDSHPMAQDDWKATFGRLPNLLSIHVHSHISSLYSLLEVLADSEGRPADDEGAAQAAWFPSLRGISCEYLDFEPWTAGKRKLVKLLAEAVGRRSDALPPLQFRIRESLNFDEADAKHIRSSVPKAKLKFTWDGYVEYTQEFSESDEVEEGTEGGGRHLITVLVE